MAKQLKAIKDDITSIEKFEFEPIKGFPMLNWKGKRPFRSTQYYPAQLKEIHGEEVNGWLNEIYWGDNLQVMSHLLKKYRGKINLVYIDPPFDSKAEYKLKIKTRSKEVKSDTNVFEEKQYSDIWTNDEFLQFIYERLILIRELLSSNGTVFLHCDNKKAAYIKIIMDEVFGESNFRNEIIWHYEKWTSPSTTSFQKNHDTILYYSKDSTNTFNVEKEITDNLKEKYEKGYLFGGGGGSEGLVVYDRDNPKAQELIASGKYKVVYSDMEGKPVSDVWKIPFINPVANERTNYPTQKPEKLLERIIKAVTKPSDIVLDCFMGSGTTQAVAMKLKRRFIGVDINLAAIQTTTRRLIALATDVSDSKPSKSTQLSLVAEDEPDDGRKEGIEAFYSGFSVYNVNHYDIFRNPVQAKDLLIEALEIQPYPAGTIWDGEKDGRKVKIMPINRIATKADLNEIIANIPWKEYERKHQDAPTKPVDYLTLVCMGHEPDLAGALQMALNNIKIDIEVVDILRDKTNLEFKRDSEAKIEVKKDKVVIKNFYPMNLLQKLSLMKRDVEEWRELVDSVMIDFNYDGAIFTPTEVDVPEDDEMVLGEYVIPKDAGNIKIKITDLLSETFEKVIEYGNQ